MSSLNRVVSSPIFWPISLPNENFGCAQNGQETDAMREQTTNDKPL